ncbi:hypothetical protein BDY17DRAFT_290821 [Neohortaea acidophila]|uniref:rRNA biogenesis protein RRP5 n=1 Tax=Neohortaea acidophila TaxID=245834 RepID=A0A6A6Q355_9PEZI|nr:uncharacterized protein BDY17DRAFT_290821 [Neohortaea acidophila]KAF2486083.1 hypothetical protein BDY17DRAFT_290821 [Neohortaea acidophila]
MSQTKRKAVADDRPNKKARASTNDSPRQHAKPPKASEKESGERRAVSKSLLQQEERAFPRGGASVLTPLDHKQIKAQAERDVLFEQNTGASLGEEEENAGAVRHAKKPKRSKSNKYEDGKVEKPSIKIHGLTSKNVVIGSMVLGCVTAISDRDVSLALANNLTGYIPITAISQRLTERIEKLAQDESDEAAADQDVNLKGLFYVGQWLRATVTATTSESESTDGKKKHHIELSVDPRQTNSDLGSDGAVLNSMVQASVRSIEDHGLVMDIGLSDADVKGFVSNKEVATTYEPSQVQEGQVMMCLVIGKSSNGKVLTLSPDASRFSILAAGNDKDLAIVSVAPTVDTFQPGVAANVLITESGPGGVAGKIIGMLDVTADLVHTGTSHNNGSAAQKFKIGSKVKGRIIWTVPTDDGGRRVGISFLDHMLVLPPIPSRLPKAASAKSKTLADDLQQRAPLSSIIESAKVTHILPERGLFFSMSGPSESSLLAFAHISQITDNRIDRLDSASGPYRMDSLHKVRILSYDPVDNLYYVALKKSIMDQPFLRVEDLTVGGAVRGTIERLVLGAKGVNGVLVKISDSINGLVPDTHLSDVQLQHPERKFKEGHPVKARVLSVDLDRRYVRLTLKRSLVNEDEMPSIWQDYAKLQPGMEGKGTIVSLLRTGAAVQFFGNVRAWLPVAEMSETYIESVEKHFRLGQTVNVRILSIDAAAQEMKVSCKSSTSFDEKQQGAWDTASAGELLSGVVSAKSAQDVTVDLENGLRGLLRIGHLTDTPGEKTQKALDKIHVGKKLSKLVVLDKLERSHTLLLSKKASLIEDAAAGSLVQSLDDLEERRSVRGFVHNVAEPGVYVEFAKGLVGLMPKSQLAPGMLTQPSLGVEKDQSITAWVLSIDLARERFALSMRKPEEHPSKPVQVTSAFSASVSNAIDESITSMSDLAVGTITKARIASVKPTQLNVRLADNVQGRIDVSEFFDTWDDISNKKAPLQRLEPNALIDVKVLGMHDARNHRFLPISHRQSSIPVFELSAKRSRIEDGDESHLAMDSIKIGSAQLAFVNNHAHNCIWVSLSPNVRGRVALMDLSSDVGQLQNLPKYFPIGSAIRTTVKSIDAAAGRLDLVVNSDASDEPVTMESLSAGMVMAGRVTKISERSINVQLSDNVVGVVSLVELSDDYDQLNLQQHQKNDIVRVCVLDVDIPNKKVYLSLRPSRVLSSSLPVQDKQITSGSQLKAGDLVRGFVKHVGDKGLHVSLGARFDGFVRISDVSDKYVKDWKSLMEIDQLVKGRVISVDTDGKSALLSLKESHVDRNYTPPLKINDLAIGMIVTGKVRKVEDFGAFVDIDNTQPRLSGLCHRSEVAAKRIEDVRKLYSAGDVVKAKILDVDVDARKISLGLKASYFADDVDEDEDDDEGGVEVDEDEDDDEDEFEEFEDDAGSEDNDVDINGGANITDIFATDEDAGEAFDDSEGEEMEVDHAAPTAGLKTSGFDWTGDTLGSAIEAPVSDSEPDAPEAKKKRKRKPEIKVDLTGDLDKYGPRSVSDFERQLLGQPNDSGLWIQYMAFQLQLAEVQKARDIAERALRTIHIRETEEKGNVWIAWLNLEVEYGDDEQAEDVFKRAAGMQDALEMHEKLASIYIDSGKHDKADAMFERIAGNKTFRASPEVWLNYATFLLDTIKEPARARSLLSRALQSVPIGEHRLLTAKFAALEFHSSQGDAERGRTIFEGLVAEWPKWTSGWDMFLDLERARLPHAVSKEAKSEARQKVRALFERMAGQKMKKRRAKFVFKRWLEFEEAEGSGKTVERVKALAKEYVEAQKAKSGGDDDTEE